MIGLHKKERGAPMLKKLASLLLSLLLCLSLLPGQALAGHEPAPADPPVILETVGPEEPEDPGIMPMREVPEGNDEGASGLD